MKIENIKENSNYKLENKFIPLVKKILFKNPDLPIKLKENYLIFNDYTIGEFRIDDLIIKIEPRNKSFTLESFFQILQFIDQPLLDDLSIPGFKETDNVLYACWDSTWLFTSAIHSAIFNVVLCLLLLLLLLLLSVPLMLFRTFNFELPAFVDVVVGEIVFTLEDEVPLALFSVPAPPILLANVGATISASSFTFILFKMVVILFTEPLFCPLGNK